MSRCFSRVSTYRLCLLVLHLSSSPVCVWWGLERAQTSELDRWRFISWLCHLLTVQFQVSYLLVKWGQHCIFHRAVTGEEWGVCVRHRVPGKQVCRSSWPLSGSSVGRPALGLTGPSSGKLLFLKRFYLFIFRERKGGRKRGRETSVCGCLLCTSYWGPGPQPRHVPWVGIEPVTLWFTEWQSIHWATPARAGKPFLTLPTPPDHTQSSFLPVFSLCVILLYHVEHSIVIGYFIPPWPYRKPSETGNYFTFREVKQHSNSGYSLKSNFLGLNTSSIVSAS